MNDGVVLLIWVTILGSLWVYAGVCANTLAENHMGIDFPLVVRPVFGPLPSPFEKQVPTIVEVLLYGKVLEGELGYRAQYARITAYLDMGSGEWRGVGESEVVTP